MSPISPQQLRKAESVKTGLAMEKLLLERLMLRKELKLRRIQEKLINQTEKLKKAEEKLLEYENLQGMLMFKAINKTLHFCKNTFSSLQRLTRWSTSKLVQVLQYSSVT